MQELKSDSLVTLWRIGEEGSFSAAARDMGWSQPAISKQIKTLERICGCALVVRTLHGVDLTPAGKILARHGQIIAFRVTQAQKELEELHRQDSTQVKLLAPPSVCLTIASRAMIHLGCSGKVEIGLEQAEPPEMMQRIADGTADCAITFKYGGVPHLLEIGDDLDFEYLGDDPLLLMTQNSSQEAKQYARDHKPIDLGELSGDKWIAGCAFCQTNLISMAHNAHFEPEIVHSTDDYLATENLVSMGMGVSIVSKLATNAGLLPNLTICPIDDPTAKRTFGILSRKRDSRPATRVVKDALRWASRPFLVMEGSNVGRP